MNVVSDPAASPMTFEEFYRSEQLALRRLAYLMTGDASSAEDLAQETFARMSAHWDTIRIPFAYARTTLARLATATRRTASRERPSEELPEQAAHERDIDEMWRLLAKLSPDHRVVLVLRYYDDLSHDQIAEHLGIPVATVRTRVHRAIDRLRGELQS